MFERTKLASMVGLTPLDRDSGQYIRKRTIFSVRGNLHKVNHMGFRCIKSLLDYLINKHKLPQ